MAHDTVKTRIQLKNDTEQNWNKAIHFIPKRGEVIIYSTDDTHPFFRLKVGDGNSYVVDLPFVDASTIEGRRIISNTTENWNAQPPFLPNAGDILIYTDKYISKTGKPIPGLKIGDGNSYSTDLPFVGEDTMELLEAHINDREIHITDEEKNFWNDKINCEDSVLDETLILNRN
jgi:hypothetical protein